MAQKKSMTINRLEENAVGVVHKTARRTRLRVPRKYRRAHELQRVSRAIEVVPGVQSVEINPQTGSMLVKHEAKHDILFDIGAAIGEVAPDLLAALVAPCFAEEAEASLVSKLLNKFFLFPTEEASCSSSQSDKKVTLRKYVSLAFLAAGVMKLIEEQSLLGSVPAIALFYWG